jgi:hypothetical protein
MANDEVFFDPVVRACLFDAGISAGRGGREGFDKACQVRITL